MNYELQKIKTVFLTKKTRQNKNNRKRKTETALKAMETDRQTERLRVTAFHGETERTRQKKRAMETNRQTGR